jgi:hypothetical protein
MFLSFLATDPDQRSGGTNGKGEDGVCKFGDQVDRHCDGLALLMM